MSSHQKHMDSTWVLRRSEDGRRLCGKFDRHPGDVQEAPVAWGLYGGDYRGVIKGITEKNMETTIYRVWGRRVQEAPATNGFCRMDFAAFVFWLLNPPENSACQCPAQIFSVPLSIVPRATGWPSTSRPCSAAKPSCTGTLAKALQRNQVK